MSDPLRCQQPIADWAPFHPPHVCLLNWLTAFIAFPHLEIWHPLKDLDMTEKELYIIYRLSPSKLHVWAASPSLSKCRFLFPLWFFWLDFHHTDPLTSCCGQIVKTWAPGCKVPPAMWLNTISTRLWKTTLATKTVSSTVNTINVVVGWKRNCFSIFSTNHFCLLQTCVLS